MALYRYFQPAADSLPDPKGPLSTKLTSSTIREANEAVRSAATKSSAKRGSYAKFTPEQQAEVAKYASMHGITAAQQSTRSAITLCKKLGVVLRWARARNKKTRLQYRYRTAKYCAVVPEQRPNSRLPPTRRPEEPRPRWPPPDTHRQPLPALFHSVLANSFIVSPTWRTKSSLTRNRHFVSCGSGMPGQLQQPGSAWEGQ